MDNSLVLAFDIGTQSARAVLVDPRGNILYIAQKQYEQPYYSLNPGWAEQRPDFYWEIICECANRLREQAGERWKDIIAVTVATIRATNICLDENGKPLRDAIVWLDNRQAKCEKKLPLHMRALFKAINMDSTVMLQRKASFCNWLEENEPEMWNKTKYFVLLSGYMNYKLCGKIVDTDASCCGRIPFDNKTRTWMTKSNPASCVFNVKNSQRFEIVKPETVLGGITAEASLATGIPEGTPLIATGSDKNCETLGLSVISDDKAAISFGTTATIEFSTSTYVEPEPFMPAYCSVVDGRWNPEKEVLRGYWLISWFKREFAAKEVMDAESQKASPEELLNERLKEIPAGCNGLLLQPYFTADTNMPFAKGAIIGFSDVHTRIHVYRAIIEGINYCLYSGMKKMEKRAKTKIKTLYVAGGGSQSAEICQITADMFGIPVVRTQTHEACGVGSAMVAFKALGFFKDYEEACAGMVHERNRFEPDMQVHKFYDEMSEQVFDKVFDKLLPLYHISDRKCKKYGLMR
ncbi:MAG: carbohydrate kinase [Firmicutes bacterium HGW-Firmicutes-16]|nr:MAG: carbohydrate kinase [Firmicutes bacterium HGW-Firmicutes-16]